MATYSQIIEGLTVFLKREGNGHDIQAAHEEIFAGCTAPDQLSEAERLVLQEHGWSWDPNFECWRHCT